MMLADRTGQYLPDSNNVIPPWLFEYSVPNDYVQAIYVPWQQSPQLSGGPAGNLTPPNAQLPLMPGLMNTSLGYARPARFLIARDVNFPSVMGQDYDDVQGISPMGQTVILTNVPQAWLVFTSLVLTPSEWDSLFREAYVAFLASEVAIPLHADKKLGLAMANRQVAIAKDKISEARAMSANEQRNINSSFPDWIQARYVGRGLGDDYGLEADGIGILGCGWGGISLGGAVF